MSKSQREKLKNVHGFVSPEEDDDNVVEMSEMVKGWQGRLRVSTNAKSG